MAYSIMLGKPRLDRGLKALRGRVYALAMHFLSENGRGALTWRP